jgi:hypothetical protein
MLAYISSLLCDSDTISASFIKADDGGRDSLRNKDINSLLTRLIAREDFVMHSVAVKASNLTAIKFVVRPYAVQTTSHLISLSEVALGLYLRCETVSQRSERT